MSLPAMAKREYAERCQFQRFPSLFTLFPAEIPLHVFEGAWGSEARLIELRIPNPEVAGSSRAVANGPVGPAMAGPIIEPANFFLFIYLFIYFYYFFWPE